jgi:3-phosphoshikimate 1-carboxyvinyltransferase
MEFKKIAIIGVGLLGGSFALAVRKYGFKGKISGVGRNIDNLKKASGLGIIDEYSTFPAEGIKDADLIMLATPVGQFEKIIKAIREEIKAGAIVTDVGSVKREIVEMVEPLMPEGVSFVGGHPIAGKECSGLDAASSDLFRGLRCIITPSDRTDNTARDKVVKLWSALGSKVSIMTPEEHDMIFAAVSHMPHVAAYVLVNTLVSIKEDILHFGGNGLRDMTRIALSPAELWRDICSYNRDSILKTLRSFSSSLSHTMELIERSDWKGLEDEFIKANKERGLLESRLLKGETERCPNVCSSKITKGGNTLSQIKVEGKAPLQGEIIPPPDKSISHRAIILSSLAEGKSVIRNLLIAEDPLRTLNAFRLMGVDIERDSADETTLESLPSSAKQIVINGKGLNGLREPMDIIDCGNSGTTMRLLSGVLAGQPFRSILTGDRFLRKRPMQRVITPLREMGAVIDSKRDGRPPLGIKGGELKPIIYKSPVASAQVKSAILLAGLYCTGTTSVQEPGRSRSHTEQMMEAAGVDIKITHYDVSIRGRASLKPLDITVPGDFSSASFFLVAGLIVPNSEIIIKNTGINPTRTGLIDILKEMNADISVENIREVSGEPVADIIVKHSQLKGIEIGKDLILRAIDEFPILCIAASRAHGVTKITGAGELRVKESDRIASMAEELRKMGVAIEELADGVTIEGVERLRAANTHSHGDHRIAMAMVIAGLAADGEVTIEDTDCINTSFPDFISMLEGL